MKIYRHAIKKLEDQKGVVAVIVGIMIVLLLSLVAFAVDIGYALVVRNELHNIADAAALAGARKLGANYETMTYLEQIGYTCDSGRALVTPVIQEVAGMNRAGGIPITINSSDIEIGQWNSATKAFTANLNPPTAVSAKARRDSSANSPITTFFARVFGIDSVNVSAKSIAGLSSASSSNQLKIPFAITEDWFTTHDPYTTTIDIGGGSGTDWFYLEGMQPNQPNLLDMINGTTPIPELKEGDTVRLNPGTKGDKAYEALVARFDVMRLINDPAQGDSDGDPSTWTMTAVITDDSGKIVGFATITIKSVTGPPANLISVQVDRTGFTEGRGGGGSIGPTMGTIPGLFQ
jgi:Flp pilus assembly protein TadG